MHLLYNLATLHGYQAATAVDNNAITVDQQGRGDGLSAELERSLQAVAQQPDRLRSESRRLEQALDLETTTTTTTTMASRVASPPAKASHPPST